jgi:hypothetical protein
VQRILKAVAASEFALPASLVDPGPDATKNDNEEYRRALETFAGKVELIFVAGHLADRPSKATLAEHVAHVANLARILERALGSPNCAELRFWLAMQLELEPAAVDIARMRTDLGRIVDTASEMARQRAERYQGAPTRQRWAPATARLAMAERVFREELAQLPSWFPTLRNGKRDGVDGFTAFVVTSHEERGLPLSVATFQSMYRRYRRTTPRK